MTDIELPVLQCGRPEITMAPLVDIVFLLLIFFMVTTVFPDNEGLVIEKPVSENTAPIDTSTIVVKLDREGHLMFRNRTVSVEDIRRLLREELVLKPDASVIVHADRRVMTGSLIEVIDAAKAGGAHKLGIATDEKPVD